MRQTGELGRCSVSYLFPSPYDKNKGYHTRFLGSEQLRSQLDKQRLHIAEQHTLIVTLQARLEAAEQAQYAKANEKRKKPHKDDKQHDASIDTSFQPPPTSEAPRPTSNLRPPSATEASGTQHDQQATQPPWFQSAIINLAKSLTDDIKAQFNVLQKDIHPIKRGTARPGQYRAGSA